ncbi:hypothetical protein [Blastococcus litoris]|uniref:hypothetical protein n=1 Tax=Blastococcus litoris TaxID=2171622 RepID=UPI000E3014C2|nr:hypothetical protein [Blastococcus litoris]
MAVIVDAELRDYVLGNGTEPFDDGVDPTFLVVTAEPWPEESLVQVLTELYRRLVVVDIDGAFEHVGARPDMTWNHYTPAYVSVGVGDRYVVIHMDTDARTERELLKVFVDIIAAEVTRLVSDVRIGVLPDGEHGSQLLVGATRMRDLPGFEEPFL